MKKSRQGVTSLKRHHDSRFLTGYRIYLPKTLTRYLIYLSSPHITTDQTLHGHNPYIASNLVFKTYFFSQAKNNLTLLVVSGRPPQYTSFTTCQLRSNSLLFPGVGFLFLDHFNNSLSDLLLWLRSRHICTLCRIYLTWSLLLTHDRM